MPSSYPALAGKLCNYCYYESTDMRESSLFFYNLLFNFTLFAFILYIYIFICFIFGSLSLQEVYLGRYESSPTYPA